MTVYKSAPISRTRRSRIGGFSIVELAVSLTVLLVLTAIAIPSLMRSFRTYQLNDAAARLSDMLKFTRFEAVRRNMQVCFLMQQPSPPGWTIGTDSSCSGTLDTNGKQQVIAGFATLLSSGVAPAPAAITASLGGATLSTLSGSVGSVTFDARGAIRAGKNGAVITTISVFYIGSLSDPEFGFRAVILLPSGSTQIWSAPNGGAWQQIS